MSKNGVKNSVLRKESRTLCWQARKTMVLLEEQLQKVCRRLGKGKHDGTIHLNDLEALTTGINKLRNIARLGKMKQLESIRVVDDRKLEVLRQLSKDADPHIRGEVAELLRKYRGDHAIRPVRVLHGMYFDRNNNVKEKDRDTKEEIVASLAKLACRFREDGEVATRVVLELRNILKYEEVNQVREYVLNQGTTIGLDFFPVVVDIMSDKDAAVKETAEDCFKVLHKRIPKH